MEKKEQAFTPKQKYAYHSNIANTGKKTDGTTVNMVSRIRHAQSAIRVHNQLDKFMKGVDFANSNKSKIK